MDLAFEIFSRGPRIFGGMEMAFEIFSRGLGFFGGINFYKGIHIDSVCRFQYHAKCRGQTPGPRY